jgi:hypothetical protein
VTYDSFRGYDAWKTRSPEDEYYETHPRVVYRVNWDNGAHACGTFPETYETQAEAQRAADVIEADNRAEGVWDEDGFCEVIEVELETERDPDDARDEAMDRRYERD